MAQQHEIGKHATSIQTIDGQTHVRYHSTNVVSFDAKNITLNTGGYYTHTTKTRMNQAASQFNLGYRVFQRDYEWYVMYKDQCKRFESERIRLVR